MKRNLTIKLLSLMLCLVLSSQVLSACTITAQSEVIPLSWEATQDEVITLSATLKKGEKNLNLVVTYDEEIFSKIKEEQVKLISYKEQFNDEGNKEIIKRDITDFSVEVNDAKKLTVNFNNPEQSNGYIVAIHSSAISLGKFGEAISTSQLLTETAKPNDAMVDITGEYAMGDKNPTITLKLTNTTMVNDISADMITLTGLFKTLTVTGVSGGESNIILTTNGIVDYATPFMAGVILDGKATASNLELTADYEIVYRSAYVKQDSFALANEKLLFDVAITNETVNFTEGESFSYDELTYTVEKINEVKNNITLSTPTTQTTLEEAISSINNTVVGIPTEKTASNNPLMFLIFVTKAQLGVTVNKIEKTGVENEYKATSSFFVKNGEWLNDLTASDIILGGSFEGATITSVNQENDVYEVVFTFTDYDLDLYDVHLDGFAYVEPELIENSSSLLPANPYTEINYSSQMLLAGGYKEITAFIPAELSTFDKISNMGSVIGNVAGVASGIYTALGILGIVESTNAKINNVRELVKDLQQSIVELDKKLDTLDATITESSFETLSSIQYNTYVAVSGNWDNFISSYVVPLQNVITEYKMAFDDYMLKYVLNAHNPSYAITLWIDQNGDVTLPHPANDSNTVKYSIEGVPLKTNESLYLASELTGVQSKVMQNGGRLYSGYWEDLAKDINNQQFTNISKSEYIEAVRMNATVSALNKVEASKILNAYTNFCNALTGYGAVAGLKPLDNYLTMLSVYYNFYTESESDIQTTIAWLHSILNEASCLATIAYSFTPSAPEGLIDNAYDKSVKKLQEASEAKDAHYCYIASKNLQASKVIHDYRNNKDTQLYPGVERNMYFDKEDYDHLIRDKHFKSGAFINEVQLKLMMNRFEKLRDSNFTPAQTFREYLVGLGIVEPTVLYNEDGTAKEVQIVMSPITLKDITMNNSVQMKVTYVYSSTWVKVGDYIKVGSNGKMNKKYFWIYFNRKADLITPEGDITTDVVLLSMVGYYEPHWYWLHDEAWSCALAYRKDMIMLRLV